MARLHLSHVSKLFGEARAVNDVSLEVADGRKDKASVRQNTTNSPECIQHCLRIYEVR